jgi:predicted nicotinamide N-methyase
MAKYPNQFGLFDTSRRKEGIRMLELGAGTGLLSILCRKLLDLKAASDEINGVTTVPSSPGRSRQSQKSQGLIVATDFLPEVLDNLKLCVDLNFPTPIATDIPVSGDSTTGINIAKLDWTTFPSFMENRHRHRGETSGEEESSRFMNEPFDLVLASDCVYDETHAKMLREVASWVLRLPESGDGDIGGTFVSISLVLISRVVADKSVAYPFAYSSDFHTRVGIY